MAYPLNWLFYSVLPFTTAYKFSLIFHLLIMGFGFHLFLRELDYSDGSALTGALGGMFSGYFIRKLMFVNFIQSISWLPILIWLFLRWSRRRSSQYLWLAGSILGIQILAGHPQGVLLTVIILALTVFFGPSGLKISSRLRFFAGAIGFGLILGAWQWLPTLRLLLQSTRGSELGFSGAVQMSMPPGYIPALIFPGLFGDAAHNTFWGNWQAYEWELSVYWGVSLTILALGARFKDHWNRFASGLAVLGIILALGEFTLIYDPISVIPILSDFRIPSRWSILTLVGVIMLAASTMTALSHADPLIRKKAAKRVSIRGLLTLITLAIFIETPRILNGLLPAHQKTMDFAIMIGLGFILVIMGVIWMVCVPGRFRVPGSFLIAIVVFVELFVAGSGYPGVGSDQILLKSPESLKQIPVEPDKEFRILSLMHESKTSWNWHGGWALENNGDYSVLQETLPMYSGLIFKRNLISFDEWSPLHYGRYQALSASLNQNILNRFSARYIIAPDDRLPFKTTVKFQDENIFILENESALPRITVTGGVPVPPGRSHRILTGMTFNYNPGKMAFFETDISSSQISPPTNWSIKIQEDVNNRLQLDVETDQAGLLVVSDAYDPGWKVWVNDEKQKLFRTDFMFRGVLVSPGTSHVSFEYRPVSVLLGLFISVIGLIVFVVIGFQWSNEKRVAESSPVGGVPILWKSLIIFLAASLLFSSIIRKDKWLKTIDNYTSDNVVQADEGVSENFFLEPGGTFS